MARNSAAGNEFDDVDTKRLVIDDLDDIIYEVSDLGSNRQFGLALGVRAPDLDKIDEEGGKVDKKLEKTISHYLNQNYDVQRHGYPNWKNIVLAVFRSNRLLARKIAANHKSAASATAPSGSGQVQDCVPKLKDLVYELKGVDWDSLGIQLDVPDATRKSIGRDHTTADKRLSEVLQYWLDNGKPSWQKMIIALERIGGHQNTIDRIRSEYI